MTFYTLAVSGGDRVRAVHEEFAGRGTDDVLNMLYMLFAGAAIMFGVLALANYVQSRVSKRENSRHRAEMNAKLQHAAKARSRY